MKTIKILFADDDLKYSMLLKRFLEAEGYEVTYETEALPYNNFP
jgi:DNA-binding response OmpR family regulator